MNSLEMKISKTKMNTAIRLMIKEKFKFNMTFIYDDCVWVPNIYMELVKIKNECE